MFASLTLSCLSRPNGRDGREDLDFQVFKAGEVPGSVKGEPKGGAKRPPT